MKLQVSADFYKSFFDNMIDGLVCCRMIFDSQNRPTDFTCLKINKSFEKVMGLKNVAGKKITELIPGIYRSNPELFEIYGRVFFSGKPESLKVNIKPLSKWFFVSVYNNPRKKNFFIAVFQDITDWKQTEKSLEDAKIAAGNVLEDFQAEKEKLMHAKAKDEALLDSIGDGVIATDQDGKIMLMNRAAERMLGWDTKQMMGKLLSDTQAILDEKGILVPEAERPINIVFSGRAAPASGSSFYFYTRKNGTKFPVAITVTPVTVKSKIIGAIEVFRDITREKEIEKMRMDFLSLASHQLRTPLSGTKWLVETIRRGVLGEMTGKQEEYLDQVYQLNERMIQLVSEMLSALRLEGGAESVKKEMVLISNLYEDLPISMKAAARSREIVLYNNLKDHNIAAIETDREILKSILECFISNAINYSQSGQEVFLGAKEDSAGVTFFVKDSGIGIPKNEQKGIFERFYRASNARLSKPGGSGLGLSIARMLAKKIGAEISFESEENKGSIFYLRIPKGSNEGAESGNNKSETKI
ncbi:MAG: PAS domain S-box protein [Candidatus Pacebacteria bacterium]|nr:PAS domain S-box protein [Candidatus Paceibacterota bacterium]